MTRSLLLSCEAVSKAYGTRSLFEELSFGLFEGDQAGLVGGPRKTRASPPTGRRYRRATRRSGPLAPRSWLYDCWAELEAKQA